MAQENNICGQLGKFITNSLCGYQFRYFILDQARGILEYYLLNNNKRLYPKGIIILAGCTHDQSYLTRMIAIHLASVPRLVRFTNCAPKIDNFG